MDRGDYFHGLGGRYANIRIHVQPYSQFPIYLGICRPFPPSLRLYDGCVDRPEAYTSWT